MASKNNYFCPVIFVAFIYSGVAVVLFENGLLHGRNSDELYIWVVPIQEIPVETQFTKSCGPNMN